MSTDGRHSPVVVVSRRAVPGREAELAAWLERIRAASATYPGHRGSTVHPPDELHPDSWTVVFRFATSEQLDAWMRSDDRAALVTEGDELITGDPVEQQVAASDETEPVTAVISFRLRPDHVDEYRVLQAQLTERLRRFPGFLRTERLDPVPGVQDETVVLTTFDTPEHLRAWLESDVRRRFLERIEPWLVGDQTVQVVGGFAGWFPAAEGGEPRRWKQAAVVLLALYPTALTTSFVMRQLLPDLPLAPSVLLGNVIGVAVLTFVLMPWLTTRLAGWLRR